MAEGNRNTNRTVLLVVNLVLLAVCAVGLILLISSGFDAVTAGRQEAEKTQGHKQELERLLEK